jgi:hypothetical protein
MRLTTGPQRIALAGDLQEQYQRRRSAPWYWSEVLTAIVVGATYDLGDHLLFVGRAIALSYVLSSTIGWLTITLHQWLGLIVWNWTVNHDFDLLRIFWFGRPRLGNPLLQTIACLNSLWLGWLVVRLHRRHAAAVLLSAVTFIGFYPVVIRYTWAVSLWPHTFFISSPFVAPTPFFMGAVAVPLCFLIGGLFGTVPEEATDDGQTVPSR